MQPSGQSQPRAQLQPSATAGAALQRSKTRNQEAEVPGSAPKGNLHSEPSQALPSITPGQPQVQDWSVLLPCTGNGQKFLHHSTGRCAPKLDNALPKDDPIPQLMGLLIADTLARGPGGGIISSQSNLVLPQFKYLNSGKAP